MRAAVKHGASGVRWGRFAVIIGVLGVIAAGVAWQGAAAAAASVVKVRFGGDQIETRMVIELDRAASAKVAEAGGEDRRIALKFDHLSAPGGVDGQGKGLIKGWSLDKAARLTLDLSRAATIKRRFLLAPGEGVSVYRYVIDIAATSPDADAGRSVASRGAPLIHTALQERPAAETRPLKLKKVIVIDAGHGGHDPGALGAESREKNVTLAAALALKKRLERGGRYRVVMTRDRDVFVPLETRVQIARQANADLFISLHADSASDPDTRGATVYTLSEKGSDRAARSVFAGGSFIDVDLPGRDRAVRQILLDLTQRQTKNRSGAFAEDLLEKVASKTLLLRRSHRNAGYVVLLAPDVPAVLMEMGFMSNHKDEAGLNDPAQRARVMDAVGDAIDEYFRGQLQYAAQ